MTEEQLNAVLYGTNGKKIKMTRVNAYGSGTYLTEFEGVINNLQRRYNETTSEYSRAEITKVMDECNCPECNGKRLNKSALAVTIGGKNIIEFTELSISKAIEFIDSLELTEKQHMIADMIIKEIKQRLSFLASVGLDYLTLSRSAGTLSGGESQRIRLATQIGSSLIGVLYILDEPTTGLHTADVHKLIEVLHRLVDNGNSVIVIEHNLDVIKTADWILDLGPEGGDEGGEIIAQGTPEQVAATEGSYTGQYLKKLLNDTEE